MTGCRDLHIGGVAAVAAGVVGVPANFRAGGRLGFMVRQSVTGCRGLRMGSGIAAVAAGIIGAPAHFRAGRSLGFMVRQRMTGCRDLHIGGVAAVAASIVSVPADFRAGGCFGFMVRQSVVIRVCFAVFRTALRTDRFGAAACCAAAAAHCLRMAPIVAAGVRMRTIAI